MNRAERRRLAKKQKNTSLGNPKGDAARLFQMAFADHQSGRFEQAGEGYGKVLQLDPDHFEALLNLGLIFNQFANHNDAMKIFHRAVALKPRHADAHYNLGNSLLASGDHEAAVPCFEKAIELNPQLVRAHFDLGFVLSESGRLEGAADAFRKVISLQPDIAEAHRHLAGISTHDDYDDDIKAMEALYSSPGITEPQRLGFAFGLAKAFEDIGEYQKAFIHLAEGNRLRRKNYAYSTTEQAGYFDRIKSTFSASLFRTLEGSGHQEAKPVFIVGMPRSGSTLVEQILASHPDVFGAGELTILSQTLRAAFGSVAEEGYADGIHRADRERFAEIGRIYMEGLRNHSPQARFITDKMPQNFLHIGMIKLALPNARVIHCKRVPEDNCLSIFKTYFPGNVHEYSCDLTELGQYYRLYEDLMGHWHRVLPGFIYDLQYEQLINDQDGQSRALIAHCDLDWDDACLEFHKTKRAVKTASLSQIRNPIYRSSVELWRRYETELSPLIEALKSRAKP